MKQLTVDIDFNQRLDKYLLKYLNKSSKAFIYKLLRKKRIKLNNKKATGSEILNKDDIVTFYLSEDTISKFREEKRFTGEEKELNIVYEDENILIANKPSGLLSQKDTRETDDTLNDRLLYYLHKKGEYTTDSLFTPSISNRLDRNTSGIVVCAKNLSAAQELRDIFSDNLIEKHYITIVKGIVNKDTEIKSFYTKDRKSNIGSIPDIRTGSSKEIYTKIKVIKNNNKYTFLNVEIISGKSHQIRLQMYHPISQHVRCEKNLTNILLPSLESHQNLLRSTNYL